MTRSVRRQRSLGYISLVLASPRTIAPHPAPVHSANMILRTLTMVCAVAAAASSLPTSEVQNTGFQLADKLRGIHFDLYPGLVREAHPERTSRWKRQIEGDETNSGDEDEGKIMVLGSEDDSSAASSDCDRPFTCPSPPVNCRNTNKSFKRFLEELNRAYKALMNSVCFNHEEPVSCDPTDPEGGGTTGDPDGSDADDGGPKDCDTDDGDPKCSDADDGDDNGGNDEEGDDDGGNDEGGDDGGYDPGEDGNGGDEDGHDEAGDDDGGNDEGGDDDGGNDPGEDGNGGNEDGHDEGGDDDGGIDEDGDDDGGYDPGEDGNGGNEDGHDEAGDDDGGHDPGEDGNVGDEDGHDEGGDDDGGNDEDGDDEGGDDGGYDPGEDSNGGDEDGHDEAGDDDGGHDEDGDDGGNDPCEDGGGSGDTDVIDPNDCPRHQSLINAIQELRDLIKAQGHHQGHRNTSCSVPLIKVNINRVGYPDDCQSFTV